MIVTYLLAVLAIMLVLCVLYAPSYWFFHYGVCE